jgi:hypothetical protein
MQQGLHRSILASANHSERKAAGANTSLVVPTLGAKYYFVVLPRLTCRFVSTQSEAPINFNLVGTSSLLAQMTFAWSSPQSPQSSVICSRKHQVCTPNGHLAIESQHASQTRHRIHSFDSAFAAARLCPEAWPASRYWNEGSMLTAPHTSFSDASRSLPVSLAMT